MTPVMADLGFGAGEFMIYFSISAAGTFVFLSIAGKLMEKHGIRLLLAAALVLPELQLYPHAVASLWTASCRYALCPRGLCGQEKNGNPTFERRIDMPLVNSREMLLDAQRHGYAVGAFNVENMEMMQAVVAAAEAEGAPVMLQTTPSTLRYADTALFAHMARAVGEKASVPVAIHLDHGDSLALCERAALDGYTSLMIDGSKLPLEENIALVHRVAEMAAALPIRPAVEAELGKLGGKEDDLEVKEGDDLYTDPAEAERFVRETGIDSLAVAIGTAHGFYKGKPKLAFDRLAQIRDVAAVPLVLHGSSGVPDEDVRRAISLGVCKVNFATELRVAYTGAVCDCLAANAAIYDPKKYGAAAREAVIALARHRIDVCKAARDC